MWTPAWQPLREQPIPPPFLLLVSTVLISDTNDSSFTSKYVELTIRYHKQNYLLLSYFTWNTGAIVKPPLLILKSLFLTSPSLQEATVSFSGKDNSRISHLPDLCFPATQMVLGSVSSICWITFSKSNICSCLYLQIITVKYVMKTKSLCAYSKTGEQYTSLEV